MSLRSDVGLRFLHRSNQFEPIPLCHPCRGFLSSTQIPTAPAVGYVVLSLRDSRNQVLSNACIFEDLGFEH
jgi:hypothetical protein